MYSHHSHSLDYIAHGVDCLEDVIARANDMNFELFCLTEHMPRIDSQYLYPEEVSNQNGEDIETLQEQFRRFLVHASEIKARELPTKCIIGMEVEGCDSNHISYAKKLMEKNKHVLQFCVGSVHHVNGIPIDFDQAEWNRALEFVGNNLKTLIKDYFELQYKLIKEMKPLVVGHFDLFRLYCSKEVFIDIETGQRVDQKFKNAICAADISFADVWDDVRALAVRNLEAIASYGGLIEINTSGLRKKLRDPYPHRDFAKLAKTIIGTRFVLSDDAHGVSHVGVCYNKALEYIDKTIELDRLHFLKEEDGALKVGCIGIEDFKKAPFWKRYNEVLRKES
ncbi:LANO_0G15126g1_1 [Lachancea nothofagi CBS 11611]|uniref:Histidinol-phosphatase n=1 Tax=Lachancea nothofagi CBS 11611 TaxID=1266666 RepID=A0A1G4KKF1_9SACH|nr:LANO_0G15126g1_1 [Lachancea nothofagi CBS 11611]